MKNLFTIMAAAIAATAVGGYGDLPNTFNASTGYVTMDTADTLADRQNSSFWDGRNWSDGKPPHATTNYYANKQFTTLLDANVILRKTQRRLCSRGKSWLPIRGQGCICIPQILRYPIFACYRAARSTGDRKTLLFTVQ